MNRDLGRDGTLAPLEQKRAQKGLCVKNVVGEATQRAPGE